MKRREFLKSMTALTAAAAVPAPAIWSPAKAQSRSETLLLVTENGPNNLDIHGVGTNRPGYEASWNCYDRLITHDKKTLPDGSLSYDRDNFTPELAEDMNVGDMSVTFKLKKNAKFQDGTPVTAKDVKWSFDRAVTRRRFSDGADEGRLARQQGSVCHRRRFDLPRRFRQEGSAHRSRSRGDRARHLQFRAGEEKRHRSRIPGDSNIPSSTPPAAAPTRSRAGNPASKSSTSATTTGSAASCPS